MSSPTSSITRGLAPSGSQRAVINLANLVLARGSRDVAVSL
ncbi:hypothetical protein [Segeticoccus rhizosphaerae]|nr:hypothetical protein [Segeticoccus rhizosphaerae]